MVTKTKPLRLPSRIFLLITLILVLQAIIPCFCARVLLQQEAYSSPAPVLATTESGYADDDDENGGDDGSKSGVQGSESRHSGSANGDRSPTAQAVQMPPPTAKTRVSYNTPSQSGNNNGYYSGGGYSPGGGYSRGGGYQPGYNYPHYP